MRRLDSYMIQATEPKQYPEGVHPHNFCCGVVAVDLEDAVRTFRAAHPDAILWTVSHRGKVEVITSGAIEAARGA